MKLYKNKYLIAIYKEDTIISVYDNVEEMALLLRLNTNTIYHSLSSNMHITIKNIRYSMHLIKMTKKEIQKGLENEARKR